MKQSFIIVSTLFLFFALFSACCYGYYVYIPKKIEKSALHSLNSIGFTDVTIGKTARENGKIVFSDIALDKQQFNSIKEIQITFSLLTALFNSHHAKNITIRGMNLSGELSDSLAITISGLNDDKSYINQLKSASIFAKTINIEESKINLLSADLGGIFVSYDGQIKYAGNGNFDIHGRASSTQKKLSFTSKMNGTLFKDSRLSLTVGAEDIAFIGSTIDIKRGSSTFTLTHSLRIKNQFSISGDAQIGSLQWLNLPLRDVDFSFESHDDNYSVSAEGKTFGNEHIEWSTRISNVNNELKTDTTIAPSKLNDISAFLQRNKHIKITPALPDHITDIDQPVLTLTATTLQAGRTNGEFKLIGNAPDLDMNGRFSFGETPNGGWNGEFDSDESTLYLNENTKAHISTTGHFSLKNDTEQGQDKNKTLKWNSDIVVHDGIITLGAIFINGITGKLSLDKPSSTLSFTPPFKAGTLQTSELFINTSNAKKPIIPSAKLRIYGGSIQTKNPIFENGALIPDNALLISDISIAQLLYDLGFKDIILSGQISGIIPISENEEKLSIKGLLLQSQDRGIIKMPAYLIKNLFPSNTLEALNIRDALRNYHYDYFEIRLDGDLSKQVMMTFNARGFNPDMPDAKAINVTFQIETQLSPLLKQLFK